MIRGLWFIAQLAVLVLAAVWLAEQKGAVSLEWHGWLVETSVGMLVVIVLVIVAALSLLWRLWRGVSGTPHMIGRLRHRRRRDRGRIALIRSLSAMAAGDGGAALRHASEAEAIGEPALAHLAAARAAEMADDTNRAKLEYTRLSERPDTALIGLKGLIGLAEARGDTAQATLLARQARKAAPQSPWAAQHLFELQRRAGAHADAERTLADAVKLGAFSAAEGERQSANLLLARAREAESQGDASDALGFTERAHKLDPALTDAAVLGARLLARSGRIPAAERMLAEGWSAAPDSVLALAWMSLAPRGDVTARVRQAERLYALDSGNLEGRLALAEAELTARRWAEARTHLAALGASVGGGETHRRYCRLMAYLESASGNESAAQSWFERSLAQGDERQIQALSSAA